ncbi:MULTISPECIES: hypothetical protein [Methylobacterium]|uniref:Excinuclease ABC subunit A n=2 Tax=Pseudomonadota TaxID=1224 RepID=A0ABQ4SW75_9HYPH|nr:MULTISPECIES: hypothetical protein [Methylobacterium]PIU05111.1 MAG: hypothetical protein COT56_16730 [Methylobacterium sp. CG09_land_8_20_14_0_10_71_15]PIU12825.1 MAG: hypothetical protein COT28_13390 [Methylobacterium sp. CG08_land_8_20_14_0_20_71_15]GBU18541.1 hypothetical protein AwMethylo_27560 [Methylobacterium sp.]GJE06168.1 hypothetical protein AOPFMNJM_1481 [Methylobacterium jeotgali]
MPRAALALLVTLAALALAPLPAAADECDGLAQRIAAATGGKVGRRSGPSIDLKVPGTNRFDVTCRAEPIVQASSGDPRPSDTYFRDLSVAAELVVGESAGAVQGIVARAYETSLREGRKSFIQQNGWSASCYTDSAGAIRTLCSVGRIPPG